MKPLIKPEVPKGMRDFLPWEMARRQYVMERIREVFIGFGYDTIETPALEYARTVHGKYGDEGTRLTYTFKDHGGRKLALRFDQTVPFARFVAANHPNLPMPFKRYQISRVWRADKPARGRFREFYQCDADIIGTDSLLAEGELVRVMVRVFEVLGFHDFLIKFNNRRLVNRLLSFLKVPEEKQVKVIRVLDKRTKIGRLRMSEELRTILPRQTVQALLSAVEAEGENLEKLQRLESFGVEEIREFLQIVEALEIPRGSLVFDPSLARGLDYYTGLIFEALLPGVNVGPVCAGGRYDDLCSAFCRETFSGVGISFGFDRLMIAMEELGRLDEVRTNAEVLVTYFGEETLARSLGILCSLQDHGIRAELYFQPDRLGKQVRYANKKGIPFVIICGPDEAARGEATIKVMKTGKQKTIPETQLVAYLKGYSHA